MRSLISHFQAYVQIKNVLLPIKEKRILILNVLKSLKKDKNILIIFRKY